MTHLTIISVGTLKEDYLKDAVAEYKKRLSQYARVEEINIKEESIKNEDSPAEIARALDTEAEKIISAMPKGKPSLFPLMRPVKSAKILKQPPTGP